MFEQLLASGGSIGADMISKNASLYFGYGQSMIFLNVLCSSYPALVRTYPDGSSRLNAACEADSDCTLHMNTLRVD